MADLGSEPAGCGVCGRSILAGEKTRTYVTRDNERYEVCDLCIVRAETAAWLPIERAGSQMPPPSRRGAGRIRSFFARAGKRVALPRLRSSAKAPDESTAAEEPSSAGGEKPAPRRRREHVAAPKPKRRSVPQRPERRIRRAFESFNASEHRKTVSGLMRSLGQPAVSAVSPDEEPGEVRITVAWELSWYQWEVDLTGENLPVRELTRGSEVSELDERDREWNAHVGDDGELRLGGVESAAAR